MRIADASIAQIADAINDLSSSHPIGDLQEIRRRLRRLSRIPTRKLFDGRTTFENYAYHVGGRTELQFNIGFEEIDSSEFFRHGIAFSLEPGRNLPNVEQLFPKIERFNDYIIAHSERFSDFEMWKYDEEGRSLNSYPAPIPAKEKRAGVFHMMGKLQPRGEVNVYSIVDDFDRLLPIYEYVEGAGRVPKIAPATGRFKFRPGCTVKPSTSRTSLGRRTLDRQLRHNDLQYRLYQVLSKKFGKKAVGTEVLTGNGTQIDAVLKRTGGYWFYEIKTGTTARSCIREALAQLLEYSYWPGSQNAKRLIIVGEPSLDDKAKQYLQTMRKKFNLPVYYEQLEMVPAEGLEPPT